MFSEFRKILSDQSGSVPGKVIGTYVMISAANIGAWIWAVSAFHSPLIEG